MTTNYQILSDSELVDKLNQQDNRAFEEVYNRYWLPLYNHARRMLKDEDEAADVVQEIFSAVLEKMGSLTFHTTLAAYLFQATRFRIINLFHREQVKIKYVQSLKAYINKHSAPADEVYREKEMAELIEHEIAALPPRMREVFELSRKAYLTNKEIAEITSISEATVKKHLAVALKRLRAKLTSALLLNFMAAILWLHRLFS
ncbi:RNA polymerase sigma-70 factor, ECF subfamily [Mucilaginibacter pineti]|uniref:RNA polymerase sigma-70 factor, ECF subfamily n=1 Tax=Mucilaginibacter pineti TaxID=1391627 RepID=A0A1G7IRF7_9SPHI|nr:sigma-70 family RNA polymerase sigma factor [Mucilaginibacter pineti]SDF15175.1 RNA polymerase sigma-70 factor, ECF subfamily [Mucilaginibacter pineti]